MSWSSPLNGKRVLVLGGGGGGIGSAVSQAVYDAGAAALTLVDIDLHRVGQEADAIRARGGVAFPLVGDVRDSTVVDGLVSEASRLMTGIDVLICVVGGHNAFAPWQPATETTDEQWHNSLQLNLDYVFFAVRSAVPTFVQQGTGGTIVAIGSLNGVRSSPMAIAYGAAKAALINVARTVSLEYAKSGIRMNLVSLGLVTTPSSDAASDPDSSSRVAAMERAIPGGAAGRPIDVANAVVFLASSLSDFVSGHNLVLDGGSSARYPLRLENTDLGMAG